MDVTGASQQITELKSTISFGKLTELLRYGLPAQKKLAEFSDKAWRIAHGVETELTDGLLSSLMKEIRDFDTSEKKGLFGKTKRVPISPDELKAKYARTDQMIELVKEELTGQRIQLLRDIHLLEELSERNSAHIDELDLYLSAGRERLEEERSGRLSQLRKKAVSDPNSEAVREAAHLEQNCNEFERRLHDLAITKTAALQLAAQIQLLLTSQTTMTAKITSALQNIIPMWKTRMTTLLGIEKLSQALYTQASLEAYTAQMAQETNRQIKSQTKELSRQTASSIDVEQMQRTNDHLLEAFNDVISLRETALANRHTLETETELLRTILQTNLPA